MAYPSVVATTSYVSSTTNATSWTPFSAATVAVGETLVFICSVDGGAGGSQATTTRVTTSSSGWSFVGRYTDGAFVTSAVLTKVATSTTESLTLTLSDVGEQWSGILLRISGAGTVTATPSGSAGFSTTNPDPPSHIASASAEHLWIAAVSHDSTTVCTAAPSGYSNLTTRAAGGTGGASTSVAYKTATSQTDDPSTFTAASQRHLTWTIAVPAAVTVSPVVYKGAGTVAQTPTMPTHVAGDLLVLAVRNKTSNTVPATPSGWTFYASDLIAASSPTPQTAGAMFYRFATSGSETVGDLGASHVGGVMCFSNADTTQPLLATPSTDLPGSQETVAQSVTTDVAGCMHIGVNWTSGNAPFDLNATYVVAHDRPNNFGYTQPMTMIWRNGTAQSAAGSTGTLSLGTDDAGTVGNVATAVRPQQAVTRRAPRSCFIA